MSIPAATSTSRVVTLPHIRELFDPNFLDVLLPGRPAPLTNVGSPAPKNPFMDALKSVSHHKLTQNGAPAFSSTLSSMLDAFQSSSADMAAARIDALLTKSWAEDPAVTLRVIWKMRSIHDGKGNKELFYRCVYPGRVRYQFADPSSVTLRAFGWLYEHHPHTAIPKLSQLVAPVCVIKSQPTQLTHDYWKDFLNILALATVDQFDVYPALFLYVPRGRYSSNRSVGPSMMMCAERRSNMTPEERDALL